jgi:hypothetical protein
MTLDLSHNKMNYIAPEAFKGLTNLTSLSLNNNGLKVNEISGSVYGCKVQMGAVRKSITICTFHVVSLET